MPAGSPSSPPSPARAFLIEPDHIDPGFIEAALTDDERTRAARFHYPDHARDWSACRAALRGILSAELKLKAHEVDLELTPEGKPWVEAPGLHFNLSHSDGIGIVLLSAHGPVGVDLEAKLRAPALLDCIDSFCHPEEIAALPDDETARAERLLEIWVHKEAVLKAVGTGMGFPPQKLSLLSALQSANPPLPGLEGLHLLPLQAPGRDNYLAAAAVPGDIDRIDWSPLPQGIDIRPTPMTSSSPSSPI